MWGFTTPTIGQIMVIKEHFVVEFRAILKNTSEYSHKGLILTELGCFKLTAWQILSNSTKSSLLVPKFVMELAKVSS